MKQIGREPFKVGRIDKRLRIVNTKIKIMLTKGGNINWNFIERLNDGKSVIKSAKQRAAGEIATKEDECVWILVANLIYNCF